MIIILTLIEILNLIKVLTLVEVSIEIWILIGVFVKIRILIQIFVEIQILITISTQIISIKITVHILIIISIEVLILIESIFLGKIRVGWEIFIFLYSFLLSCWFRHCTWYLFRGLHWVPWPCLFTSYWLFCLVTIFLNWLPCEFYLLIVEQTENRLLLCDLLFDWFYFLLVLFVLSLFYYFVFAISGLLCEIFQLLEIVNFVCFVFVVRF